MKIFYIERTTGQQVTEKIYKENALELFYGDSWMSRWVGSWLLPYIAEWHWFSVIYGRLQKHPSSTRKIVPFIEAFDIDVSEFSDPLSHFRSFNDFFIRRLKPEARPLVVDPNVAIIPADGRYYFYENIEQCPGFIVKGQKFTLKQLFNTRTEPQQEYLEGSMVIARLCPADYHRFHFPFDCVPGPSRLINGPLYSVNPLAIRQNIRILAENKRMLCELESPLFGPVWYMEIGATTVGSIQETYKPGEQQSKGAEKGYFEFGGSALIVVFPKGSIRFDADLLAASQKGLEIRCLLGQSMGQSLRGGKILL